MVPRCFDWMGDDMVGPGAENFSTSAYTRRTSYTALLKSISPDVKIPSRVRVYLLAREIESSQTCGGQCRVYLVLCFEDFPTLFGLIAGLKCRC